VVLKTLGNPFGLACRMLAAHGGTVGPLGGNYLRAPDTLADLHGHLCLTFNADSKPRKSAANFGNSFSQAFA